MTTEPWTAERDADFRAAADGTGKQRTSILASDVRSRRVRWLYKGRLALGYVGVWTGAGDIGKSMFAAWVINAVSRGKLDGEFQGIPEMSLIVATEDGREDMWKPRLAAVGADLERVAFLEIPYGWNLRDGIDRISDAIDDRGAVFVFIDAAMEHMPPSRGGENVNSPTFVRGAMGPLARLSRERQITSLFGLHPPKARAKTFADTVQASGAFSQLSRTGLLFGYHPDDRDLPREEQRRVVLRGKGNAGRNPAHSPTASPNASSNSTTATATRSATSPTSSPATLQNANSSAPTGHKHPTPTSANPPKPNRSNS